MRHLELNVRENIFRSISLGGICRRENCHSKETLLEILSNSEKGKCVISSVKIT